MEYKDADLIRTRDPKVCEYNGPVDLIKSGAAY